MRTASADRRSLWWGSRPDTLEPQQFTGELPKDVDVLVAGAGLTGLCTAVMLARAGRTPLVVEAHRAGSGTTGHSSAKLSLLQGSMLQRLRTHASADTVRAHVEANRAGQAWLLDLVRDHDVPHDIRLAVTYAVTPDGAEQLAREREASLDAGLDVIDDPDHGLPFAVEAAIGLAGQAQIDPLGAVEALTAELAAAGGRLVEGVRVVEVSQDRPWQVLTTAGTVTAGHVVLATQAPILDRSLHFAGLRAGRSYVLAYPVDSGSVPGAMALSLDDPARSLRTATVGGRHFLLVGGNGHTVGRGGSTAEKVADLDRWARAHFPVTEPEWSWSAQDYHLTTQLPSIGPIRGSHGSILVATGFDKWGMAMAAAAGQLLTGDVTGEHPAYAATLRAEGFGVRDALATGAQTADIGAHWIGARAALALPDPSDGVPAEGEGRIEGGPLGPVAVSTVDGTTCRVSGLCTHLGGVLAWNDAERSWDCPLHGSRFAADGTLLEGPATSSLRRRDG